MKTAALVLPLAFGLTGVATPETVAWEAYALVGPGRELLGKGVKSYSPAKDIVVEEQGTDGGGSPAWQKSLLLDETFALSASVHREASLDGFGLVIFRRGDANGFSWEWFDRVQGNVFARRQGSGPGRDHDQEGRRPGGAGVGRVPGGCHAPVSRRHEEAAGHPHARGGHPERERLPDDPARREVTA